LFFSFFWNIFVGKIKIMDDKVRHFGGKLFVKKVGKKWTAEERLERNIEKQHLKAYLRGDVQYRHYSFGYTIQGIPTYKKVNAIWV
jgi:hypothetical protein